jgi:hypothetical protein
MAASQLRKRQAPLKAPLREGPATAVGFSSVRLRFELDTDASAGQQEKLIELTERYCFFLSDA